MKNSRLILAAAAALLLASGCEKTAPAPGAAAGDGKCSLDVRFDDGILRTRLTGVTTADEATIKNVQVFVFRSDDGNILDACMSAGFGSPLDYDASSQPYEGLQLNCTTGEREIWAVVNAAQDYTADKSIGTLDDLLKKTSSLSENARDKLFMTGSKKAVLSAGPSTQTISVRRACASVVLESVTNAMSAAVYRQPGSFRIKDVYLMNVPGKVNFGGTLKASALADADWYARMAAETDGTKSALILDKQDAVTVEYGKKYETKHVFYSNPNDCAPSSSDTWCRRATVLVIEAEFKLSGEWHACYYPVTLHDEDGDGLESNRQYRVRLTVNRPGSDNPNHPVEFDVVSGVIDVADWESGAEYTETI